MQREQAPLLEASIRQSPVVVMAFALQTKGAQAHTNPAIQGGHHVCDLSDTEIPRPSAQNRIEVCEDSIDIPALLATRQRPDFVLEPFDGFWPDAQTVASKSEPEKLEALPEIREASFRLME